MRSPLRGLRVFRLVLGGFILISSLWGCQALSGDTRGYRTNNPGNVVKTDITWKGEVECADLVNECFSHPKYGIRAMVVLLNNYYHKHNLRSLDEIIYRYGPKHKELAHTRFQYRAFLSRNIGIPCGKRYWGVLGDVIQSIIYFENGYVDRSIPIDQYIKEALIELKIDRKKRWRCK